MGANRGVCGDLCNSGSGLEVECPAIGDPFAGTEMQLCDLLIELGHIRIIQQGAGALDMPGHALLLQPGQLGIV